MLVVALKYVVTFLLSFTLATWLIRFWIPKLETDEDADKKTPGAGGYKSTGFWIGFCETLMVFVFVAGEDYGAIAIIIGAKEFVRKEKIQANPAYYLLGTLVNVAVALLAAIIAREWVKT